MALTHRLHPVWLFPLTYGLHLFEEYVAADGFASWAGRALALRVTGAEFVAWNAFALALMCTGAWLVSRDAKFRFIEIALAIAVLGNAVGHLLGSLVTWTYSPGLITGIALWIPLGVLRLRSNCSASTRRTRMAGTLLGLCVVLITLAVLAAGAISRG